MVERQQRVADLIARIERHVADCMAYEGHVFDLHPDEQQIVLDALRAMNIHERKA